MTAETPQHTRPARPARPADRAAPVRRFAWVAFGWPAIAVALGVVLQLVALPFLPDPVATHWGASGRPDGFGPAWISPTLTALVGLGIPALLTAVCLPGMRRGGRGPSYRLLGAVSAAAATLLTVLTTASLLLQVGIEDAVAAPSIVPALVVSYVAAAGAGIAAWRALPQDPALDEPLEHAAPLALAPGERAVWLRTATIARAGIVVLVVATLVLIGAAVVVLLVGPTPVFWIVATVAVAAVAAMATTTAFHVRVDAAGLRVESALGLPRFRVPLADVASVGVVDVDPVGEFGGWGLRVATGRRFGVVLRRGEAIEVVRRSGRRFVVTVDDAATGAALLGALAARPPAA